jgi:hypothetical protein
MPDTLLDLAAAVDDARVAVDEAGMMAARLGALEGAGGRAAGHAAMAEVCRRLEVARAALADALAPVAAAVAAEKRAWDEAQRGDGAVPY